MLIYFLTSEPDLCQLYCEALRRRGHVCIIYTENSSFYLAVKEKEYSEIGLLVIDYWKFDHDCFNPFTHMKSINCVVPVVYYNCSYPGDQYFVEYWCRKNLFLLRGFVDEETVENLRPVLADLKDAVDRHCQQEKIESYEKLLEDKSSCNPSDALYLSGKYRLSPSRQKLLKIFLENENTAVTEQFLCISLWKQYCPKNVRNLYTYIHDLRIFFSDVEKKENIKFSLVKDGNLSYRFSADLKQHI